MKKLKKITLGRGLKNLSSTDMINIVGGCTGKWYYFLGCSWQQETFYAVKDCSTETIMAYCNTLQDTHCVAVETM